MKEIKDIDVSKVSKENNDSTKIITENADVFSSFI